jgi:hypothetical protein
MISSTETHPTLWQIKFSLFNAMAHENDLLHLGRQRSTVGVGLTKAFMPLALPRFFTGAKKIYPIIKLVFAIHLIVLSCVLPFWKLAFYWIFLHDEHQILVTKSTAAEFRFNAFPLFCESPVDIGQI